MSSRSFRRRSNRRRHKAGGAPEPTPQGEQGERPVNPRKPQPQGGPPRAGGGQRRDGRGAGRRSQGRPIEPQRPLPPPIPIVYPDCPICGKQVRDLPSALPHRISRQPAHFDCIVQELRDTNEVGPEEKLCYLGGGSFGILEFRASGGPGHFIIKKRIQYEEKEIQQDWKKPLQVTW